MSYQKCPKCDGQGIVSKPPYVPGDVTQWSATSTSFPCDVCNGLKIITGPPVTYEEHWRTIQTLVAELEKARAELAALRVHQGNIEKVNAEIMWTELQEAKAIIEEYESFFDEVAAWMKRVQEVRK